MTSLTKIYHFSGTRTGQAVQYVTNEILTEENGDRLDVQNVVIVITDGVAQDGDILDSASDALRSKGTLVSRRLIEIKKVD